MYLIIILINLEVFNKYMRLLILVKYRLIYNSILKNKFRKVNFRKVKNYKTSVLTGFLEMQIIKHFFSTKIDFLEFSKIL